MDRADGNHPKLLSISQDSKIFSMVKIKKKCERKAPPFFEICHLCKIWCAAGIILKLPRHGSTKTSTRSMAGATRDWQFRGTRVCCSNALNQSHESVGLRNASLVADTENVKITTGSKNQYACAIRCSMRSVNLCSIYELYKLIQIIVVHTHQTQGLLFNISS